MRYLTLCFLFALTTFVLSPAAQAQDLGKEAKIEKILSLTNSQAQMNRTFDQMTTMIGSQMKSMMPNATPEQLAHAQEMQKKVLDMVRERLAWDKMRADYIRIYSELYTDQEIDGMLTFFSSPAGKSYLEKTPELTQKVMAATQAQMTNLMPDIQKMVRDSAAKR